MKIALLLVFLLPLIVYSTAQYEDTASAVQEEAPGSVVEVDVSNSGVQDEVSSSDAEEKKAGQSGRNIRTAGEKGCCKDKDCAELTADCATGEKCKISYTELDGVAEKGDCTARDATKTEDCDGPLLTDGCWCDPDEQAPAKACQQKSRGGLMPPVATKSCCADAACHIPTSCNDTQVYCSWSTTGEADMTGGKCAEEGQGDGKMCNAKIGAPTATCTCKIEAGKIPCNFGFKRGDWGSPADDKTSTDGATGETSSKAASGPTSPSNDQETTVNGSASVRTTILTTVYPVITMLGVALFSFSPA